MKGLLTVGMLTISNVFMTLAWYGHLKFKDYSWGSKLGIVAIILISWGMAFFEYVFQVPANKIGFIENGGPFSLIQLKVIQEVISLSVFTVMVMLIFKGEAIKWNHILAFVLLIIAVYLVFKK